jgi:uncharacterized lipoprotein YmbA
VKHSQIFRRYILLFGGILFVSCATKEPENRFFVLTQPGDTGMRHAKGISVFVRRIEVAPYLARTNLVEMRGGNQPVYAPTARWAEPLDQGVARAVADSLRRSFGFQAYGFSPGGPPPEHSYDVTIRLERFEGNDNGDVVLVARWGISGSGSAASDTSHTSEIHRTGWQPGDYTSLARLLSEEVDELGRRIGRAIR